MNYTGFLRIVRVVFAMLMALSVTATMSAQTSAKSMTPKKSTKATAKVSHGKAASTSAPGQRAFIDPVTHKLYTPSPEELQALEGGKKPMLKASPKLQVKQHPNGARSVMVPEEAMSYSVATKAPDGKITFACVDSKKKADQIVQGKGTAENKEAANEK